VLMRTLLTSFLLTESIKTEKLMGSTVLRGTLIEIKTPTIISASTINQMLTGGKRFTWTPS
jgi:hypothetical protein